MLRIVHALFLLPLIGCADFALMDSEKGQNPYDTGSLDTSDDTDPLEAPNPKFWSLEGTLTVAGGNIVPETSAIEFAFWYDEIDSCVYTVDLVESVSAYEARPDETLLAWWDLSLSYPQDLTDCDWSVEGADTDEAGGAALSIGIGPFDDRLAGALYAAGTDPSNSSTYGLYMADPKNPDSLLVFGVAGTEDQYGQPNAIDPSAPLPDGTYRLTALYLFTY